MTKRTLSVLTVLAIAVLAAAPAGAGTPIRLLPATAGDLAPAGIVAPSNAKALPPLSRETVTFSWALKPDEPIQTTVEPHTASSREYWQRVTAAELREGVTVHTTAPGALVRINPVRESLTDALVAIDPHNLTLRTPDGRVLTGGEGMDQLATPEQLAEADVPFPAGTSAFRLDGALGAGDIIVRAADLPAGDDAVYVVTVLDRESPAELRLRAAADVAFAGSSIGAVAALADGDRTLPIETATARLVSPDGAVTPLDAAIAADGTVRISGRLPREIGPADGLWEIHVTVAGALDGMTVRRDVRTAFAAVVPTARLTGDATVAAVDGGLRITFGVETAAAGRYEVRGVLFGTGDDGALHPAVRADAAAWLEAGAGSLDLVIDGGTLAAAGLHAPFELRDLRLLDQGRMFVLSRQARAVVLGRDVLAGLRLSEGARP